MNQRQKKQRNRKPVSCWPCRERKVRCDRSSPCVTCERRDHAHLCRVERPNHLSAHDAHSLHTRPTPRQPETAENSPLGLPTVSTADVASSIVSCDAGTGEPGEPGDASRLIALLDDVARLLKPTNQTENTTRERIYLGQNCAANFFRALANQTPSRRLLPGDVSVESAFGLTNRTTLHPFGSLWSYAGDVSLKNILQSLPTIEACLRYTWDCSRMTTQASS